MCFFTIYNELFVVVIAVSIGTPTILVLLFVADFSARWIAIYDYALTFANAVTRNLFGGGGTARSNHHSYNFLLFFPKIPRDPIDTEGIKNNNNTNNVILFSKKA